VPKRKKKAHEQTTDEALKRIFRKPFLKRLKEMLAEIDSEKRGGKRDRRNRNDD
jgi:hypothetical protein